MSVTVEVRHNRFPRTKELTKTATTRRTNTIRRFIRDRAQGYAPYETGFLHDNIELTPDGVAGFADYDADQEFGTIHQSGTPHFRPAMRDAQAELARFFDGFQAEITS